MFITIDNLKNILSQFKNNIDAQMKTPSPQLKQTEPSDKDIPIVNIIGTLPTSKNNTPCKMEYCSMTDSFTANIKIKWQGSSTLMWDKKNFAIELYSDEFFNIPFNRSFKNWGSHNVYVLKANYTDHLHSRNIACANLWADIVRSRTDINELPQELKESPNMGAIDGFPIKLYTNGEYQGIYTWNIPKKDWLFNMDKSNENHIVLQGNINDWGDEASRFNPCNFNATWDGSTGFTVEIGDEGEALTASVNNIITSVINSDTATLETILDIQSAIDYFIFQDVILGIDGLSNNILLFTYDMQKWYLGAYDMDSTFGLYADGTLYGYSDDIMPDHYSNVFSELLALLTNNYDTETKARYAELRKGVLSYSSIIVEFEKILSTIDEDERIKDVVPYPNIPNITTNTLNALRQFVKERLDYLDIKYEVVI